MDTEVLFSVSKSRKRTDCHLGSKEDLLVKLLRRIKKSRYRLQTTKIDVKRNIETESTINISTRVHIYEARWKREKYVQ